VNEKLMNLNEKFPVSFHKVKELIQRIHALKIEPSQIREEFSCGGGPGGQKINKTANCVTLHYDPLNLMIRAQKARQRSLNRFLALRELVDRIEMQYSPRTSIRLKQISKLQKQKARRRRRSLKKIFLLT